MFEADRRDQNLFPKLLKNYVDDHLDEKTSQLKEKMRAPFHKHLWKHYKIGSASQWRDAAKSLMSEVDNYPLVGVCVRTGDNLIGMLIKKVFQHKSYFFLLGILTLYTMADTAYTFNLKSPRVPGAIFRLLTNPDVLKMGYGARKGLDRLYERGVLSKRAQGVVDLYKFLNEEVEWKRPVYAFMRNRSYTTIRDPERVRHGRRMSGDVKCFKGDDKLIFLCTNEVTSALEAEKNSFNREFFRKDYKPYVRGIENNDKCLFHCAAYSHWGLYLTLLAFFPKIVQGDSVGSMDEFIPKAMDFFGVSSTKHFLPEDYNQNCGVRNLLLKSSISK